MIARDDVVVEFFKNGRKLGLSGASGSGKTTIAALLRDRFGCILHGEGVRTWLAKNGGLVYSELTHTQHAALQEHLLSGYEKSVANVFDRTPLDVIVYSRRNVLSEELDSLIDRARRALLLFDVLVLFPAHSPFLVNDGVRIARFEMQMLIFAEMAVEALQLEMQGRLIVYDHSLTQEQNLKVIEESIRAAQVVERV